MSLQLDFIHHILSLQEAYRGTSPDRILLGKGSLSREERTALALQLTAESALRRKLPQLAHGWGFPSLITDAGAVLERRSCPL